MRKLTSIQKSEGLARIAKGESARSVALSLGVSPAHMARLARGKLRTAEEFGGAMSVKAPQRNQDPGVWDLEAIRNARDDQMHGQFAAPVQLARSMRTVGELFVAYHNRIAPQAAIAAELVSAGGVRGDSIVKKATESVILPRSTLQGIVGTFANHGLAVGINRRLVEDDGSLVGFRHEEWPLEHVRWNASLEILETTIKDGSAPVPIVHGNGTWVVYRKFDVDPWAQEAAVLPGAMLWAALAYGARDWSAGSASHGQAKIVGELPDGYSLRDSDGNLTPMGREFMSLLHDLVSGEAGAGIKPFGSKLEFLSNGSQAWQVFKELMLNREKIAARIYLGTDAILGSVGGAPGVDIAALFGVATTKIQGDFGCLAGALNTGLYQPWAAINFGDSRHAPSLKFQLPDPDAAKKVEQYNTRLQGFFAAVEAHKNLGFTVDQDVINALAAKYDVVAPTLAPLADAAVPLQLAPTDVAKVVRAIEIRRSQGLPPFGDERDGKTIPELDAAAAAAATAAANLGAPTGQAA